MTGQAPKSADKATFRHKTRDLLFCGGAYFTLRVEMRVLRGKRERRQRRCADRAPGGPLRRLSAHCETESAVGDMLVD
jgi:hypothetical protein